jgi:hypothetical protein
MSGYSSYYAAPTTQQAVVTVNAGIDRLFCNYRKGIDASRTWGALLTSDEHCYSIAQREVCMKLKDKYDIMISRPSSNGINDMALKVFSSANNLTRPGVATDKAEKYVKSRHLLRDMFTFVGVATTPLDYLNTNNKDTLALQIAGSVTVFNTGTSQIRAGQRIIWDVPSLDSSVTMRKRTIRGEPMSKRLFVIMPLEDALAEKRGTYADASSDFVSTLHAVHSHTSDDGGFKAATEDAAMLNTLWKNMVNVINSANPATAMDTTKEYNRAVLHMYNEVYSRVIGIALSSGGPGDPIDIMLCSSH